MSEEKKPTDAPSKEGAAPPAKKSGGMVKIIIFSLVGIVVLGGLGMGVMIFLKADAPIKAADEKKSDSLKAEPQIKKKSPEKAEDFVELTDEEILSIGDSESFMAEVQRNLDMLDFDPEADTEMTEESVEMSKKDSIDAAQWFAKESARLAAWDEELKKKQRELEKQERGISQKITKIEQAESVRVTNLAKMYDNMEPIAVARLVANLDDGTVVSILPRMKQKNASMLLSLMPPQRAASLSKQMITIAEN